LDLINENAGKQIVHKKKRLQKVADREQSPSARDAVKGEEQDEQAFKKAADEEEAEQIDTSTRFKLIAPAARRPVDHRDLALAQKASKIFDDPSQLDAKAK
jgi:hypothetical protein